MQLKVHSQQGGLCLILGEPGTGKIVLKGDIVAHDPKNWITHNTFGKTERGLC